MPAVWPVRPGWAFAGGRAHQGSSTRQSAAADRGALGGRRVADRAGATSVRRGVLLCPCRADSMRVGPNVPARGGETMPAEGSLEQRLASLEAAVRELQRRLDSQA